MAKHWWILVAVLVIWLGALFARSIATSLSGLDKKEVAVVRRAAGPSHFGGGGGGGGLVGLVLGMLKLLVLVSWCVAYYRHRAAVRKVVGFNPRKQDRAEGVIFSFYELRMTRTELIKGYDENARRIRLQGLSATVAKSDIRDRVDVTIEGPDTKFVYSKPYDIVAGFNPRRARQFAALLNYEASLLSATQSDGNEKSTKVRCLHCQHVQTVPVSQRTFTCAQCSAHLKRGTASARG